MDDEYTTPSRDAVIREAERLTRAAGLAWTFDLDEALARDILTPRFGWPHFRDLRDTPIPKLKKTKKVLKAIARKRMRKNTRGNQKGK